MEYNVELYEKEDGKIPVLEYITGLNPKQQAKIYREIDLLEKFGNELHYPHVDKIEGKKYKGLWELRTEFASNIFRIFFFVQKDNAKIPNAVLLHGIVKKTNKTPKKELDIALDRMKDHIKEESKMKWNEAKKIILKNKEIQNELKMNEAEYKIIEEIIMARKEKNLTQKDLAELIGTKQSNISRLESGNYNPSIDFLSKVAFAVGKELKVSML